MWSSRRLYTGHFRQPFYSGIRSQHSQLKDWGFEINPWGWCMANKTINGKHCTILWHMDDLKISHVDAKAVTKVIKLL
jgi:hypothetical protein